MQVPEAEQLKDVVITISYVAYDDDEKPYPATMVFRYDLQGDALNFIMQVEAIQDMVVERRMIVEGGPMRNQS